MLLASAVIRDSKLCPLLIEVLGTRNNKTGQCFFNNPEKAYLSYRYSMENILSQFVSIEKCSLVKNVAMCLSNDLNIQIHCDLDFD